MEKVYQIEFMNYTNCMKTTVSNNDENASEKILACW